MIELYVGLPVTREILTKADWVEVDRNVHAKATHYECGDWAVCFYDGEKFGEIYYIW